MKIFLAMLCCSSFAQAQGSLGLGARTMGMGGAGTALMGASESLFHNPAGLGGATQIQWAALGSYGGTGGEARHALALVIPLKAGVLAISAEDTRLAKLGAYREQELALGLALPLSAWTWLGTSQRLINAAPGDLQGWSMDLGTHWNVSGSLWGGDSLELGLAAQNLVSQLSWSRGPPESLPLNLSASLAIAPWASGRMVLQADLSDRADLGRANLWKAGVEQWVWKHHGAIRAGFAAGDAAPANASFGAGLRFPLFSQEWIFDYAALVPASDSGSGSVLAARHLFSLALNFYGRDAATGPQPSLTGLMRDEEMQDRSLVLDFAAVPDSKSWEIVLRDDQGRVLRSYRARGPLPATLAWDGLDEDGRAVTSAGVSYTLRVVNAQGRELKRHSILFGEPGLFNEIGEAGIRSGTSKHSLRAEKEVLARTGVRPLLCDGPDSEMAGVTFDFGSLASRKIRKWSLKVVDESGRTLKTYQGEGRPPADLSWEGTTDIGVPAARAKSAGFVLRVINEDGGENTQTGDLLPVQVSTLPLPNLPEKQLRALAEPLSKCQVNFDLSECRCRFHFAHGGTAILPEEIQTFKDLVKFSRRGGLSDISIHGFTDNAGSSAANQRLSEKRAEMLLASLEAFQINSSQTALAGFGDAQPVADNASAGGRALNRRVEVTVRRPEAAYETRAAAGEAR